MNMNSGGLCWPRLPSPALGRSESSEGPAQLSVGDPLEAPDGPRLEGALLPL